MATIACSQPSCNAALTVSPNRKLQERLQQIEQNFGTERLSIIRWEECYNTTEKLTLCRKVSRSVQHAHIYILRTPLFPLNMTQAYSGWKRHCVEMLVEVFNTHTFTYCEHLCSH